MTLPVRVPSVMWTTVSERFLPRSILQTQIPSPLGVSGLSEWNLFFPSRIPTVNSPSKWSMAVRVQPFAIESSGGGGGA